MSVISSHSLLLISLHLSFFRVLSNRMNMTNCTVSLLLIERKTTELALSEERPSLVVGLSFSCTIFGTGSNWFSHLLCLVHFQPRQFLASKCVVKRKNSKQTREINIVCLFCSNVSVTNWKKKRKKNFWKWVNRKVAYEIGLCICKDGFYRKHSITVACWYNLINQLLNGFLCFVTISNYGLGYIHL